MPVCLIMSKRNQRGERHTLYVQSSHSELEARHSKAVLELSRTKEALLDETAKWTSIVEGHVREKHAMSQIQGYLTTEKELHEERARELEAMVPIMQEELREACAV